MDALSNKPRSGGWRVWAGMVLALNGGMPGGAHEPGLSALDVQARDDVVQFQIDIALADVVSGWPDGDLNQDGVWSQSELTLGRDRLSEMMAQTLQVRLKTTAVGVVSDSLEWDEDRVELLWIGHGERPARGSWEIESSLFALAPSGHRQFTTVKQADGTVLREALLSERSPKMAIEWGTVAMVESTTESAVLTETQAPRWGRVGAFFGLGVEHILIGFDHLLFLAGLLVACQRVKAMLGVITSFTVAHSITLGLAATGVVDLPGSIVEPLIAASIVYVGIENIVKRGREPKGRWALTFTFGLIHGFGFAGVLRELGIGSGPEVVPALLGFNLGVEVGQCLAALAVFPLLMWARKQPKFEPRGPVVISILISLMGAFWLVERTFWSG